MEEGEAFVHAPFFTLSQLVLTTSFSYPHFTPLSPPSPPTPSLPLIDTPSLPFPLPYPLTPPLTPHPLSPPHPPLSPPHSLSFPLTPSSQVDALRRCAFRELPPTLIIHLKRFEFDLSTMGRMKVNDHITFPMDLNMFPYTEEGLYAKEVQQLPLK